MRTWQMFPLHAHPPSPVAIAEMVAKAPRIKIRNAVLLMGSDFVINPKIKIIIPARGNINGK
ncbi:hypothetical protein I6I98_13040 [Sphingobacterium multivorum]|uniref:Uncharacterized protein n=1 Tax=Sphingobacterium multivorum TaxID=28454 RepID=A0ABX7CWR0_SPHMU|nr:hypothetical protein [Sphingobacterium multivorum]QQT56128.1 hypothetical protein I6I98_13040 [Sphingobacterium multivorum]